MVDDNFNSAADRAAQRLADIEEPSAEFLQASEREEVAGRRTVHHALVVLVTDHVIASGKDTDRLVTELLEEGNYAVDAVVSVRSDESAIRTAIETAVVGGADLVITIGGTGVGPRDKAPEATEAVLDLKLNGVTQALRSSGLACGAVDACVSRGVAGVSGSTVVVNIAPSRAAIRDGMATLLPLVDHVIEQLQNWSVED
ncbi:MULTISPECIES: molybdenum cofactor biosynthesis protein B [Corynebacterium]|uniref:MogA/MoaB family molybdenum cofactor biosynthesis protein n=1 Tax=Corynebacterium TaxID=1716 RepID=UPI00124C19DB|nr:MULTISPECIES: molybdopterin-binding protein [Corynebacterium]MBV7281333.1 molybdenum cofactor biosynthesis protein [Corynebacterium sp. TAE3-ERU30]MBV7301901.1 molybdenum cofactor biosynthesis protein [Corynebacterium sp. TAE3-ERU2]